VIDLMPPDGVESGPCRFDLTLTRPDADPLSRHLDFEVGASPPLPSTRAFVEKD
jgi:hypothetical protein